MADEKKSPQSADLLTELSAKIDRTLSTAAQASLQSARAVRLIHANQELDARQRMAQVEASERFRRDVQQFGQFVERMADALGVRPPTLTTVETPHSEDITGVFVLGRRMPSRWIKWVVLAIVFAMFFAGVIVGALGMRPSTVVKAVAPAAGER